MPAGTGVNLNVEAKERTTADIIQIAGSIGLKKSYITIKNAQTKTTEGLIQITMVYPNNITVDLVENLEVPTKSPRP